MAVDDGTVSTTDRDALPERKSHGPSAAAWLGAFSLGLTTAMLLTVRTVPDVDLWLHLRIGDLLRLGERFGPPPDQLAVLADREYVPTQWLGQVAMSAVYDGFG